jgi:8-oxo-dGTP diphosphatase
VLDDDVRFVCAEENMFASSAPKRHYVTMCLTGHVVNEKGLKNMDPDKCDGWEWVDADELVDDTSKYRPLFVPLRNIFEEMGLVEPTEVDSP